MEFEQEIFEIARLIVREKNGQITPEEKVVLDRWRQHSERNACLYERYQDPVYWENKFSGRSGEKVGKAFLRFSAQVDRIQRKHFLRVRLAYAAMICVPLLILTLLIRDYRHASVEPVLYTAIQPGTTKAVLVLGDGREVELTGQEKKLTETGTTVWAGSNGITYHNEGKTSGTIKMNVIRIPRGGEYKLQFSDSTRVWLNSESEIRFPVRFSGNSREVYVKGEVYFEVAPNTACPFVVKTDIAKVEVLGTSFNVRCYASENVMAATLVEGQVRVFDGGNEQAVIRPGQQGEVERGREGIRVLEVDISKYTAWKEGRFAFSNQTLGEIMNMLARWYDIEVGFDSEETRAITFTGDLKRYDDFGHIIRMLEITRKIRCDVSGNYVFIRKAATSKE